MSTTLAPTHGLQYNRIGLTVATLMNIRPIFGNMMQKVAMRDKNQKVLYMG